MRFAHFADCHIGGWREPRLAEATTKAFAKAVDMCVEKGVDFVLISGDLFNTSLPALDRLKEAVVKLRELKELSIPVYAIAGSHDFSASGKSIIEVLENAGLLTTVMNGCMAEGKLSLKFVIDPKTNAKLVGIVGKKGALDKAYYEALSKEDLEGESGFKIFLFHTALSEFKPEGMECVESAPVSSLPKNFGYYAGGHVHYVFKAEGNGGVIAYPGPLFPNSFSELEKLENGGFYIVEENCGKVRAEWQPVVVHNLFKVCLDCNGKTAQEVEAALLCSVKEREFNNTIVTIRLFGTLKEGRVSDINFKKIADELYSRSAHFVMKNTAALTAYDVLDVRSETGSVEEIESALINAASNNSAYAELTMQLMIALDREKGEEKVADFERRLVEESYRLLEL